MVRADGHRLGGAVVPMLSPRSHVREEAAMTMIPADELRLGDVVEYSGEQHRVSRILRQSGWSWPVASDDAGWAIALGHELLPVLRAA
jgi:hypothetical protein